MTLSCAPGRPDAPRYDPWADLAERWPEVAVVVEPMSGLLLGELRYPVIALRASSSAAQRRCTLTHEIVHLDRGLGQCGPWAAREEAVVHAEAARRLIDLDQLLDALRGLGEDGRAPGSVASALDVDLDTLRCRVRGLTRLETSRLRAALAELAELSEPDQPTAWRRPA